MEALDEVRWVQPSPAARARDRRLRARSPTVPRPSRTSTRSPTQPLVVGVRRLLHDLPADAIVDPKLVAGIRQLPRAESDLRHLRQARAAPSGCRARRGVPGDARLCSTTSASRPSLMRSLDPWRADLARLAGFPNVTCKLSGLATEAASGWSSADVRPYLEHALEVFGPMRCMIGSDWPVVTLAGTMERWFDAVLDVVSRCPHMTGTPFSAKPRRRLRDRTVKVRVTSRSRLSLTELSLGCSQLGNLYRAITDDEAAATVEKAWKLGIRYFDTAPHYGLGLSERRLGAALAGRSREEYVVSTKVGRRLEPAAAAVRPRRRGLRRACDAAASVGFQSGRRSSLPRGESRPAGARSRRRRLPSRPRRPLGRRRRARPTRRSKSCALRASSRRSVQA